MFCPHCGKENDNGVAFCGSCGKAINKPTSAPVNRTVKPYVVKNTNPLITKDRMIFGILSFIAILLYFSVFAFFIVLLNNSSAVSLNTIFDSEITGNVSFSEVLKILISGNRIFNPTIISTAFGVGIYCLIYSLPVFAVFALYGIFSGKKRVAFTTLFCIITVITAAVSVAVTPVSVALIPGFKQALASSGSVLGNDVKSVSYIMVIVFAAIALVLLIASMIYTNFFVKRRAKK